MREYRVVATKKEVSCKDGHETTHNVSYVSLGGGNVFRGITQDANKAKEWLEFVKKANAKYEKEHNAEAGINGCLITYSNYRIQSRNITDWEDQWGKQK